MQIGYEDYYGDSESSYNSGNGVETDNTSSDDEVDSTPCYNCSGCVKPTIPFWVVSNDAPRCVYNDPTYGELELDRPSQATEPENFAPEIPEVTENTKATIIKSLKEKESLSETRYPIDTERENAEKHMREVVQRLAFVNYDIDPEYFNVQWIQNQIYYLDGFFWHTNKDVFNLARQWMYENPGQSLSGFIPPWKYCCIPWKYTEYPPGYPCGWDDDEHVVACALWQYPRSPVVPLK